MLHPEFHLLRPFGSGLTVCGGGWWVLGWWWCKPTLEFIFRPSVELNKILFHEFPAWLGSIIKLDKVKKYKRCNIYKVA